MPDLDLERLRAYSVPVQRDSYDPRDTILYALGRGAGLAPVIPGDMICTEIWREGEEVLFRALVPERGGW